ncbi:MAG: hypothetical protein R3244_06035 [Thermoanaerobaculia bacterium]|nr:hypothetical protein [Thermoanaerobaculia bacterium]
MSDFLRLTTVLVGILAVLVLGAGILVAGTVASAGVVTVRVQETGPDGLNLYLPVPANLVEASIAVAPVVARLGGSDDVDRELARVRAEIEPWLPALEGLLDEIRRMPDATLVEVTAPNESVVVKKRRGAIEVRVEERGSRVEVVVPLRIVDGLKSLLERV